MNHTDDSGEIMIRQKDFILKPVSHASVVVRTRRFLGWEYQYCLQTSSGKELHARTMTDMALPVRRKVELSIASDTVKVFPH
ncbi:hypothetical protein [Nostoc sp.]|uniref:hypothetical protein n=1 Tax=Nostoc sp. TaxID=1180 RepID=UPI002FF7BE6D